MSTGARLGNGHSDIEFQGRVVVHAALFIKHAAVTVVGKLIQAGIGHQQDVIAKFFAQQAQRAVEYTFRIPGWGALGIFVFLARDAKQVHAAHAGLIGFADGLNQGFLGVLVYPRHRGNLFRLLNPIGEKHRQD